MLYSNTEGGFSPLEQNQSVTPQSKPKPIFGLWNKINQLATKAGITALEQTEALKSTSEQNQSVGLTVAHM
ncbi:hypothetical protein C1366_25965 [Salmonella enterica]|nr:hypothetical protein [Salmonella enterica]EBJ7485050.1 hypothetical protein [Salmonella enterica]ECI4531054.1 hypothetical protein [Salmonella enterica subsp. diarizonae]HBM0000547.1 hypothetical protein [Salmonella enterica subsp. enterica serovar Kodjovi]